MENNSAISLVQHSFCYLLFDDITLIQVSMSQIIPKIFRFISLVFVKWMWRLEDLYNFKSFTFFNTGFVAWDVNCCLFSLHFLCTSIKSVGQKNHFKCNLVIVKCCWPILLQKCNVYCKNVNLFDLSLYLYVLYI